MNTLDPAVTSASAAVTIDDLTDAATVGAGIDLAYTYIRRNGKWKNIAFV